MKNDPRHVMPEEARQGRRVQGAIAEAYRGSRERVVPPDFLAMVDQMEREMRRLSLQGRIVYTLFPSWGNKGRGTWQVYVL